MKKPHHRLSDGEKSKLRDAAPDALQSVSGGSVYGELHGPAFTHISPNSMPLPVLIAVPHAGRVYPSETLAQMRDIELSQLRLEDRYVDKLGVAIAKSTGTGLLVSHAPRAMIDLNRAHDDVDWEMIDGPARRSTTPKPVLTSTNRRARSGLGLVPRRLPGFGEIWRQRLSRAELDRRIDRIHRPYHAFLAQELQAIRDKWGAALLIDLHSMPPLRKRNGQDQPPRVVLGDRFGASCQNSLVARAYHFLEDSGQSVAHNRPYSGGYVLDRHAAPPRGIHAIQVEVCRSAYLDDQLSEPSNALEPLGQLLAELIRQLGADTAHLGSNGRMAQAAE